MPLFLAAMGGMLLNMATSIVGRVLLALGISVLTFTGASVSLTWLKQQALDNLHALPPTIVGLLSYMKVGVCISIIFSAIVARMALNGLNSDTFKRLVHR